MGHQKQQVYAVPLRANEDLVARIQTDMTTVDANVLKRVPEMPCDALPSDNLIICAT